MLHAKRNKVNGLYFAGCSTDLWTRAKTLDIYFQGKTFAEISNCTGLTLRGAWKICDHYVSTGSLTPFTKSGSERSIMMGNVVQHIEYYKTRVSQAYTTGKSKKIWL